MAPRSPHCTRNRRGFTLVELVTVIVVLGLLATIAVPKFLDFRQDAMTAADEKSIASISSALNVAFLEHRVRDAPVTEWIRWSGMIKDAMESDQLPDGIELGITTDGYKLRDQRGNTYRLTPETNKSAAVLVMDGAGAAGFS